MDCIDTYYCLKMDCVLPEDGLYQYLLQPGEEHDDQRCRATDRIWSKGTYRLREIVENPVNHVIKTK